MGAAGNSRHQVGADRQDRHLRGVRAGLQVAARPDDRRRPGACWWWSLTGAWLSRSLLGPLRELTAGVTRFAAGDYGAKVSVRTRDEIGALCTAFNGMVDELRDKNVVIENKNRENEELLLNVLPAPIANRLRGGEQGIADGFAEVTVAFADLVGFTAMSSDMPPADVVDPAERPVHPLRRGRPRARHREDQDGGRRLHGGVRPAGAGARPCRAHGAHGDPHGPHHARACAWSTTSR